MRRRTRPSIATSRWAVATGFSTVLLLAACSTDAPGGATASSSSSTSAGSSAPAASAPAMTSSSVMTSSSAMTSGAVASVMSSASSSPAMTGGGSGTGLTTGSVAALTLSAAQLATAKQKASGLTIGILSPLSSEYLSNVVSGAKQEAAALGAKTSVVDYDFDDAKAVSGMENLVSQGAKYIVADLTDPPAMIGAVKAAEAAGVTVVQFAGDQVAQQTKGYSVAIDDKDLGTAAGEAAAAVAKTRGAVQIAILDYPSQPNVVIRADAMVAAIKAGAPQAQIVGRVTGGTEDAGLTGSESLLQRYPNLGGIVSVNDAGAYGALQAFQSAGKTGSNAFVVGCDAESKARSLIKSGGIYKATVDTQPGLTGQAAVDLIGQLLAGNTPAKMTTVPVRTITK